MKNQVFEDRIKYWESRNPVFKKVFDQQEETYKLIAFVDQIIDLFKATTVAVMLSENDLVNFIDGLVMTPLIKSGDKDSPAATKSKKLTDPVLKYLRKIYSSEGWREYIIKKEITGDEVLVINGVEIPISIAQMKLHTERLNKYPLLREHVAAIEVDLVEYKRKQFTQPIPQPVKIIKTGILESFHAAFNGEIFNASEEDFINAINDPVNFGHLIKPIKGKQTYMYFLLGQLSGHIKDQPEWERQICIALGYNFETYLKKKSGTELSNDFNDKFKSITF